jgi:hypothetical protein
LTANNAFLEATTMIQGSGPSRGHRHPDGRGLSGDVRLSREALKDAKVLVALNVTTDGDETLKYLRRQPRALVAPSEVHGMHVLGMRMRLDPCPQPCCMSPRQKSSASASTANGLELDEASMDHGICSANT